MGKVKSAICLTLMSLLIAGLCFICFVSFGLPNGIDTYNSILQMTQKDADLGMRYGGADDESDRYLGGGYTAVYYPEGVISAEEYETALKGMEEDADKQDYTEQYAKFGGLYFDTEKIKSKGGAAYEPNDDFKAQFESAVELFTARYEALHLEDVRVSVFDDYAVRVFVPQNDGAAFTPLSYTGDFTVKYGSDASSAATIMPARSTEEITDYVKGAYWRTGADGSSFVVIDFTKKGRTALANASSGAADSSATVFFRVGDNDALQLSVSEQIDQDSLYISNSSFTEISAKSSAVLIDTAVNGVKTELAFSVKDGSFRHAQYGENSLLWLYIVFGVFALAMMVFFFVRYHLLGLAHLYTYLLFLCGTVLCVWAIPFLTLSVETFIAFMLTSVLLCVSDAVTFEKARAEYATGKTMVSSVKTGYSKCFWNLFDLHIVLALAGFFTFFVALPALSNFAFVFGLTAVFSGLGSLLINRFNWAILMAYTPKKGAFCNFAREETEDE